MLFVSTLRHGATLAGLALASLMVSVPAHAAKSCAALRTGAYHVFNPERPDVNARFGHLSVDAKRMTVLINGSELIDLTPGSEPCLYTVPNGVVRVASPSGILLHRDNATGEFALAVPAQSVAVKSLIGRWNYIRQTFDDSHQMDVANGVVEILRGGKVMVNQCGNGTTDACSSPQLLGRFSANPEGGFDLQEQGTGGVVNRTFALRSKTGALMMVVVGKGAQPALAVLSPAEPVSLPAVGEAWSFWDFGMQANGSLPAPTTMGFQILSANATAGSYVRQRDFDCRKETWFINQGRDGLNFRPSAPFTRCNNSTGTTASVLTLGGLRKNFGLTAYGWQSSVPTEPRVFGLSVSRP